MPFTPDNRDPKLVEDCIEALLAWYEFQSERNGAELYRRAMLLFGSDFNPAEYDDVE
jgi:hypothetical protein